MSTAYALNLLITVPIAAGLVALVLGRRLSLVTKVMAVAVTLAALWAALFLYRLPGKADGVDLLSVPQLPGPVFFLDSLNSLVLLLTAVFALVILVYSCGFLNDASTSPRLYYASLLWTLACVSGTILSRNLLVFVFFWGLVCIPFYLLVNIGTGKAAAAAKKALIVVGGTDALLILGVGLIYHLTGSLDITQSAIPLTGIGLAACLCLTSAAFGKAGVMPLHSWVPEVADSAPVPVVALLPASLDKLLGIYFFARISIGLFTITPGVRALFILVGAVTIVAAAMAALVQQRIRRLLGFQEVSQVGYIVMAVAAGTPLAVIGGIFHMLNHAIYKSCLFLTAGAVERRTGTGELAELGGLVRQMPVTFAAALVSALAISGVPPLNGFVSKWMIYQGIIELGPRPGVWIVALVAAMFGSAITLASFVKVLHSVFLGQKPAGAKYEGPKPNFLMGFSMVALAGACIVFGVWAFAVPVTKLILPSLASLGVNPGSDFLQNPSWKPGLATALLVAALLVGLVIYALSRIKVREDDIFVGGEVGQTAEDFRFAGTGFYETVARMPFLRKAYRHAEEGWYDVYELGRRTVFYVASMLQACHSGLLLTYVAWTVAGLVLLLWFLS